MGANEKHAATYHGGEYVPTANDIREVWGGFSEYGGLVIRPSGTATFLDDRYAEFDRWLETVRAEAKAEALHEVLTVLNAEIEDAPPANYEEDNYEAGYIDGLMFAEEFTETRADQYNEEPTNGC